MGTAGIEVKQISGALGAEIHGVDLSQTLSNSEFDAVHQAFLDHQVIFFRDQNISPEQHIAFGRRFGELDLHPFADGMEDYPEIIHVLKEAKDHSERTFGGGWHTDVTFYEKPALGSILYALDVPESGGDTQFANMYMAYDSLSDGMKSMLDGMTAIHSASRAYGERGRTLHRDKDSYTSMKTHVPVRTRKSRWNTRSCERTRKPGAKEYSWNRGFTVRFKDWTEAESVPLLEFLYTHAVRPEFTCRFRWEKARSRSGTTGVPIILRSTTITASAAPCTALRFAATARSKSLARNMLLLSLAIVESDGRSGPPGDAGHRPRTATHQPADKRQPSGWPLFHRWRASASACDASSIAARTLPTQR